MPEAKSAMILSYELCILEEGLKISYINRFSNSNELASDL